MNRPRELPFKLFEALNMSSDPKRDGVEVVLAKSKRAIFGEFFVIDDVTPSIEELEQYEKDLTVQLAHSKEKQFVILLLKHQINLMKEVQKNGKKDS